MNKIVKIGFPMEYEDDEHIIRIGLWLKEYEVEMLEKKLNEYNHLQSKIDKANEILNKLCIYGYGQVNCRPIKNTTKQEVYNAMYEIKNILKEAENVENN